jgi:hypothetical protein
MGFECQLNVEARKKKPLGKCRRQLGSYTSTLLFLVTVVNEAG